MRRRALEAAGSGLYAAFGELARRAPRATYASIAGLAAASAPVGRSTVDPAELRTFVPELSAAEAARAARAAWRQHLWEYLHAAVANQGGEAVLDELVDDGGALARLRGPVILATWHVGPFNLMPRALARVPGEVMVLSMEGIRFAPGRPNLLIGDERSRVQAFYHGLAGLRRGASIFVAIDTPPRTIGVPLLGREAHFARGAFAFARRAGVPIVPLLLTWEGHGGRAHVGPPLDPVTDEEAAAVTLAGWLEAHLRRQPSLLNAGWLAHLRRDGPWSGPPAAARAAPSR